MKSALAVIRVTTLLSVFATWWFFSAATEGLNRFLFRFGRETSLIREEARKHPTEVSIARDRTATALGNALDGIHWQHSRVCLTASAFSALVAGLTLFAGDRLKRALGEESHFKGPVRELP
jgi:hypothetical protein